MQSFDGTRLSFFASAIREIELNRNYIQRFIDERCRLEDREEIWNYIMMMPQIGIAIANSYKASNDERVNAMLAEIFKPKLTIIFAGIKGGGKTALLYLAGEQYHKETGRDVCVFNPLNYKQDILPKYFYDAYHEQDIKPKSLVLFDEAQIFISCLKSDTKIRGKNGNTPLNSLKISDTVKSYNFIKGMIENDTVTAIQKNITDTLKIQLSNNGIIECSSNHRWFVRDKNRIILKEAKDLNTDDVLIIID